MQGGGPQGAPVHGRSHCAGRARESRGGRTRPAEIRAWLGLQLWFYAPWCRGGKPRQGGGVQGEGDGISCCYRSTSQPCVHERPRSAVSGGRARCFSFPACIGVPGQAWGARECGVVPGLPAASLGWRAQNLRGRRARLGEVWRTAARTSRGLLAAHFRLWTVTRRAAQAERTHSISSISLGHLPNPSDDIKLSGWRLFRTSATHVRKLGKGA